MAILVIEDHADNLDLIRYLLGAFGYVVLCAETGLAGMEMAENDHPDLILCDIQLPDLDGFEVARRLKRHAQLRLIPLVAITALAMVGDRERVLAAGFDGYISKPISPQTFVEDVGAFLKAARKS